MLLTVLFKLLFCVLCVSGAAGSAQHGSESRGTWNRCSFDRYNELPLGTSELLCWVCFFCGRRECAVWQLIHVVPGTYAFVTIITICPFVPLMVHLLVWGRRGCATWQLTHVVPGTYAFVIIVTSCPLVPLMFHLLVWGRRGCATWRLRRGVGTLPPSQRSTAACARQQQA
jgi:hypothetical protein